MNLRSKYEFYTMYSKRIKNCLKYLAFLNPSTRVLTTLVRVEYRRDNNIAYFSREVSDLLTTLVSKKCSDRYSLLLLLSVLIVVSEL